MKSIDRVIICVVFVLLFATFVSAETKKPAASGKVVNDLLRQLFQDCKAAAPSPDSWDEKEIDGPANDFIDVKLVPLSSGKITYLITGKHPLFFGARTEMHWIYEKTTSGYRQIGDLGANDSVRVLVSSHNGYRDIETNYFSEAGTVLNTCKYLYNGNKYVDVSCKSKRIRR